MKIILMITICLIFSSLSLKGQNKRSNKDTLDKIEYVKESDSIYMIFIEKLPEFPGGEKELQNFLDKNLKYRKTAINNKLEIVWVLFTVDSFGKLKDFKIRKGVSPELDKEAIRVLKLMPNWKPGQKNEQNIDVYVTLSVKFYLPDYKKDNSK